MNTQHIPLHDEWLARRFAERGFAEWPGVQPAQLQQPAKRAVDTLVCRVEVWMKCHTSSPDVHVRALHAIA